MGKEWIKLKFLSGILMLVLFGMPACGIQVDAAFPHDMEEKNVVADSLTSDKVIIYRDSERRQCKNVVSGENFSIRISKAFGDALYGTYKSGDIEGTGWIYSGTLVLNPDFKNVYATVRDQMTIYTDSSCENDKATIDKYTGVILVSKKGNGRQVIYDQGDHYGIGWMDSDEYANSLKYDGREKQILADGTYHARCGYQDDETGGLEDQSEMEAYPEHIFQLIHLENNIYRICDTDTGKYLQASPNLEKDTWTMLWKKEPDEYFGNFEISRLDGSFTIMNTYTGAYYGQTEEGTDILVEESDDNNTHWRLIATEKVADIRHPFVITQYDPQWCASSYGSEGCIGTAGCGILAPVNAVYSLSGQYMDVMELADYAVEKHYRIEGSGTTEEVFKAFAKKFGKKYGFSWDGKGDTIKELKKKLQEGEVAVVYVPGHYVCINAYDEKKDRYLLLDSNCLPKREDSPYGDWIGPERLMEGMLQSQGYYFYKLREK